MSKNLRSDIVKLLTHGGTNYGRMVLTYQSHERVYIEDWNLPVFINVQIRSNLSGIPQFYYPRCNFVHEVGYVAFPILQPKAREREKIRLPEAIVNQILKENKANG